MNVSHPVVQLSQSTKFGDRRGRGLERGRLTGNEAKSSDDNTTDGDIEQLVPRGTALTIETDLLEHNVLIKVDTVKPSRE
jgi:hypothetical protein